MKRPAENPTIPQNVDAISPARTISSLYPSSALIFFANKLREITQKMAATAATKNTNPWPYIAGSWAFAANISPITPVNPIGKDISQFIFAALY